MRKIRISRGGARKSTGSVTSAPLRVGLFTPLLNTQEERLNSSKSSLVSCFLAMWFSAYSSPRSRNSHPKLAHAPARLRAATSLALLSNLSPKRTRLARQPGARSPDQHLPHFLAAKAVRQALSYVLHSSQRRALLTTITRRVAAVAETHAHLRTRLPTRHLSVGGGRCLMSCPLRKGARRTVSSPPNRMIEEINCGSCSHTVCVYNVLHPPRGIRRWSSMTLSSLSVLANGTAHVHGVK